MKCRPRRAVCVADFNDPRKIKKEATRRKAAVKKRTQEHLSLAGL